MKSFHLSLVLTLLLVTCGSNPQVDTAPPSEETSSSEEVPVNLNPTGEGPWNGSLYMTTSEDGLHFNGRTKVLDRAGVPNLLELQDGTLVLFYQYFSNTDASLFDTIAYSTSDDNGQTWTDPKAINLTELPTPAGPGRKAMDPTLVQLEDGRLRLYFTYHAKGNTTAALYSATTADDQLNSPFVVTQTPALITDENLLDPAVVFFDGLWHHYSWKMENTDNYHSTSSDGLSFTRQDDISLPMDFLGQVIPFEDGLRFYGTGEGVTTAYSKDGSSWEIDGTNLAQGADPAVQELSDGTFLMIYTSKNFNE